MSSAPSSVVSNSVNDDYRNGQVASSTLKPKVVDTSVDGLLNEIRILSDRETLFRLKLRERRRQLPHGRAGMTLVFLIQ